MDAQHSPAAVLSRERRLLLRDHAGMLGWIILAALGLWWLAVAFVALHFIVAYW